MTYMCPKGHDSADADYCSECGSPMNGIQPGVEKLAQPDKIETTSQNTLCPDCGTTRNNGSRFCEVCRYDFQSKTSYTAVIMQTPDNQLPPSQGVVADSKTVPMDPIEPLEPLEAEEDAVSVPSVKLNVVIKTDPTLLTEEERMANYPKDTTERVFPLDLDENLVGRRKADKNIYPEIDVNDTGVSHRHLKFIKQKDGSFAALELGSANGTKFNGQDLEPGIITPIKAGDEFIVGMWTRLELRTRS